MASLRSCKSAARGLLALEPDETSLGYELAPIGAVTVKFTHG